MCHHVRSAFYSFCKHRKFLIRSCLVTNALEAGLILEIQPEAAQSFDGQEEVVFTDGDVRG